jgi:hypothetical protein
LEAERIKTLEDKVLRVIRVVDDLQRKVEHIQRLVGDQDSVAPLSAGTTPMYQENIKASVRLTPSQERTLLATFKAPSKGVTAQEVAKTTGRSVNLESSNLHDLSLRRLLLRTRIGRKVYYIPEREHKQTASW